MEHGFTREQFDLLRQWQGYRVDASDPRQASAYASLKEAYRATEAWAAELQRRLFPLGTTEIRKAPINQGQAFSPYTWAKIYPAPSSPRELAYTVGIDSGGFMVKIDTVGNPPVRAAYEALRGPDNQGSPFAEILSIEGGLRLSLEQLVAWSASAIGRFRMGYEEVAERIGLPRPKLALVTDQEASSRAFAAWRRILLAEAVRKGPIYWLLEGGIVMRPTRSGRSGDEDGLDLGIDPNGQVWAVQINEPRVPGSHNSGSAIGIDAAGKLFLLRQGLLRPNLTGGHTISGIEFVSRTGLVPVPVEAQGLAVKRQWFVVCALDSSPDDMRRATSRFVDRCAAARISADAGEAPPAIDSAEEFGAGERGGTYTLSARPAQGERTILRVQGAVWLALAKLVNEAGLRIRKGRHPLGFEVDAEIDDGKTTPLLVEIKTGISAGELHAGVGQLHIYPRLIPRLAAYDRVLLLPRTPAKAVCAAIESCGIAIHTYDLREGGGAEPEVSFQADFLRRCGISGAG